MATGFELNYCQICGVRLSPDDFDGICSECDAGIPFPSADLTPEEERAFLDTLDDDACTT
jgi:hypothetical protein